MDFIQSGLANTMVYIDDIIKFSADEKGHIKDLERTLNKMRQAGLKVKTKKCHLFSTKVTFLGHVVSAEGVTRPGKSGQSP